MSKKPNKATCDLLMGLASQFSKAGAMFPQWRHFYSRCLDQPDKKWISRTGPCRNGPIPKAILEKEPRDAFGYWESQSKLRQDRFRELVCQTWCLLPESLKGQRDDPAEGWFAIVYDRLAGTSLVREWCGDDPSGLLYEYRGLTVNPFEASAYAIKLLFAPAVKIEKAVGNGTATSLGKKAGTKPADDKSKRGRKDGPMTAQRRDFAKPLRKKGMTWKEIAIEYSKEYPRDLEASDDTIRLACTRKTDGGNQPK